MVESISMESSLQSPLQPIDPSFLRYKLREFTDLGDPYSFERLAKDIIAVRICRNFAPATAPSYGGDEGRDGLTHPVLYDSLNELPLYVSSTKETAHLTVFAISTSKQWERKVRADLKKAMALEPIGFAFVTNQRVQEKKKALLEKELHDAFGVEVNIYDEEYLVTHLSNPECYHLAVRHLNAPSVKDPEMVAIINRVYGLKREGLSDSETLEVERLKKALRTRSIYEGHPEHEAADLRRLGEILMEYEAHCNEARRYLHESMRLQKQCGNLIGELYTTYSYYRLLFKIPGGQEEILSSLDAFIRSIISLGKSSLFIWITTWLLYLTPLSLQSEDHKRIWEKSLKAAQDFFKKRMSDKNLGEYSRSIVKLCLIDIGLMEKAPGGLESALRYVLGQYRSLFETGKNVALFPMDILAGKLSRTTLFEDMEGFREFFDDVLAEMSRREGAYAKAQHLKDRGIAHYKEGNLTRAISYLTESKALTYAEPVMRGFLLCTVCLGHLYESLGLLSAAKYEYMQAIRITTRQPVFMEEDVLVGAYRALYYVALSEGDVVTSVKLACVAYSIKNRFRIEDSMWGDFDNMFYTNTLTVLLHYKSKGEEQKLAELLEVTRQWAPQIAKDYGGFTSSDEKTLEEYASDLDETSKRGLLEVRDKIAAGDFTISDLPSSVPLETYCTVLYPPFEKIKIKIEHGEDNLSQLAAYVIAVVFEQLSGLLVKELESVDIIEDRVTIRVNANETAKRIISSDMDIEEGVGIAVVIPNQLCETLTDVRTCRDAYLRIGWQLFAEVINWISLDEPEDVARLLLGDTKSQELFINHFQWVPAGVVYRDFESIKERLRPEGNNETDNRS